MKSYHDPVAAAGTGTTSSHGVKYPDRKQSCDSQDPGRFQEVEVNLGSLSSASERGTRGPSETTFTAIGGQR